MDEAHGRKARRLLLLSDVPAEAQKEKTSIPWEVYLTCSERGLHSVLGLWWTHHTLIL